jgi:hypothetical protein
VHAYSVHWVTCLRVHQPFPTTTRKSCRSSDDTSIMTFRIVIIVPENAGISSAVPKQPRLGQCLHVGEQGTGEHGDGT